jgi:hypothetical protein
MRAQRTLGLSSGTIIGALIVLALLQAVGGGGHPAPARVNPSSSKPRDIIIHLGWTGGLEANFQITVAGPAFPPADVAAVTFGPQTYTRPMTNGVTYGPLHLVQHHTYQEIHHYDPAAAKAGPSTVTVTGYLSSLGRSLERTDTFKCEVASQGKFIPLAKDSAAGHRKKHPDEPYNVTCIAGIA